MNLHRALLVIRNSDQFSTVREWLETELKAELEYLAGSNDDRAMHIAQGSARRLTKILSMIEESPRVLDKAPR